MVFEKKYCLHPSTITLNLEACKSCKLALSARLFKRKNSGTRTIGTIGFMKILHINQTHFVVVLLEHKNNNLSKKILSIIDIDRTTHLYIYTCSSNKVRYLNFCFVLRKIARAHTTAYAIFTFGFVYIFLSFFFLFQFKDYQALLKFIS